MSPLICTSYRSRCASIKTVLYIFITFMILCTIKVLRLYVELVSLYTKKEFTPSLDEIKNLMMKKECNCECKPRFHKSSFANSVKATISFEGLNLDFEATVCLFPCLHFLGCHPPYIFGPMS